MTVKDILPMNKGRFKISEGITKSPKIMAFLFENFRPLKYDLDIYSGIYYILCESELFDNVEEGNIIPEYTLSIKSEEDGSLTLLSLSKC